MKRKTNGLVQELSEREPNEENVRTRFTALSDLQSDLHNLENAWYDIFAKER
jgi:hypothetical protein